MPIIIADKKRFIIFLTVIVLIITAVIGGIFAWKKYKSSKENPENQPQIYEALIQTKGKDRYESEEDRRTFFENGDVLVIFPQGHPWTKSEKEETIIKLELKQEQVDQLTESITKPASSADGESGEGEEKKQETVLLRKFKIKLKKINPSKRDKVYDEGVIEEK